MRTLNHSVVKDGSYQERQISLCFHPILTYGHESLVMIERVRLQTQASEIQGIMIFDKICFAAI